MGTTIADADRTQALMDSPSQELASERRKPYHSTQIQIASHLKHNIKSILKVYYNRKLESFNNFQFHIYTAKSNMLQRQTIGRLCDKRAGCLDPLIYHEADDKELLQLAGKHVDKYIYCDSAKNRSLALQADAKCNPGTLYLIIFDEAHWGVGKGDDQKERSAAHEKLIGPWDCDVFNNVIILQVSATGYNLKSSSSALPHNHHYIKYKGVETGTLKEMVAQKSDSEYEDVLTKNGTQRSVSTDNVVSSEMLHFVKWSEGHQSKFCQGVIIRLGVPTSESCRWITTDIYATSSETHPSVYTTSEKKQALKLYFWGESMDKMKIVTMNSNRSQYLLAVKQTGDHRQLSFVSITSESFDRLEYPELQDDMDDSSETYVGLFEVDLSYGEDLMMIKTVPLGDGKQYHLRYSEVDKMLVLSSTPPDSRGLIQGIGLDSPSIDYMFTIDHCQSYEGTIISEYISLNLFYNSMRHAAPKERLIRSDDRFNNLFEHCMAKLIKEESITVPVDCGGTESKQRKGTSTKGIRTQYAQKRNTLLNEQIAAGYAFNIILHSMLQRCSLQIHSLHDFIRNPTKYEEVFQLSSDIQRFIEELLAKKSKCISAANFQLFMEFNQEKYVRDERRYFHSLAACLLYLPRDKLIKYIRELPDSPELAIKFSSRYKNDLKQLIVQQLRHDETFSIITKVCKEKKFVVSRAHTRNMGDVLFHTIIAARLVCGTDRMNFAAIRDYDDNFGKDPLLDISQRKIYQSFQPSRCQWRNSKTFHQCDCSDYVARVPEDKASLDCASCGHQHKEMRGYEDMDGLPCILILVNKGRFGDTFPRSFSALDLRQWFHWDDVIKKRGEPVIFLSRIVQELGRLCRYDRKPGCRGPLGHDTIHTDLPYVLLGEYLHDKLRESLKKHATFHGYFVENGRLDDKLIVEPDTHEGTKLHKLVLKATGNNFDFHNEKCQYNRILLEAEPQIGKTGVYLNLISQFTQQLGQSQITTSYQLVDNRCSSDSEDEEDEKMAVDSENNEDEFGVTVVTETRAEGFHHPQFTTLTRLEHCHGDAKKENKYRTGGGEQSEVSTSVQKRMYAERQQLRERRQKNIEEEIGRDEYRARGLLHSRDGCSVCCSHDSMVIHRDYQLQVADEQTVTLNISSPFQKRFSPLLGALRVEAPLSAPSEQFSSNSKDSITSSASDNLQPRELESWIFTPTYNRAEDGCFNYRHTMVDVEGRKCLYVQILVVREEEFDVYSHHWGKTHAIIKLPGECHIDGKTQTAREGGIGYARHIIMKLAKAWNLGQIFMIDDNYISMQDLVTEMRGEEEYIVKDHENRVTTANIPLFKALKEMERLLIYPDKPHEGVSRCVKMLGDSFQPVHDYDPDHLGAFTGNPCNYAVIGCHRDRGSRKITSNFRRVNVYSLILINMRHQAWNGLNFRCVTSREDIMLYRDLMKLKKPPLVLKFMRFMFRKAHLRSHIVQKMYDWPRGVRLPSSNVKLMKVSPAKEQDILISYIQRELRPGFVIINMKEGKQYGKKNRWAKTFFIKSPGETLLFTQLDTSFKVNDVIQKLKDTPGIGGYLKHVFILSKTFCYDNKLKEKKEFLHYFVRKGFDKGTTAKVLTTHRITDYRINYIILVVDGKIRDPCDYGRLCNVTSKTPLMDKPQKRRKRRANVIDSDSESASSVTVAEHVTSFKAGSEKTLSKRYRPHLPDEENISNMDESAMADLEKQINRKKKTAKKRAKKIMVDSDSESSTTPTVERKLLKFSKSGAAVEQRRRSSYRKPVISDDEDKQFNPEERNLSIGDDLPDLDNEKGEGNSSDSDDTVDYELASYYDKKSCTPGDDDVIIIHERSSRDRGISLVSNARADADVSDDDMTVVPVSSRTKMLRYKRLAVPDSSDEENADVSHVTSDAQSLSDMTSGEEMTSEDSGDTSDSHDGYDDSIFTNEGSSDEQDVSENEQDSSKNERDVSNSESDVSNSDGSGEDTESSDEEDEASDGEDIVYLTHRNLPSPLKARLLAPKLYSGNTPRFEAILRMGNIKGKMVSWGSNAIIADRTIFNDKIYTFREFSFRLKPGDSHFTPYPYEVVLENPTFLKAEPDDPSFSPARFTTGYIPRSGNSHVKTDYNTRGKVIEMERTFLGVIVTVCDRKRRRTRVNVLSNTPQLQQLVLKLTQYHRSRKHIKLFNLNLDLWQSNYGGLKATNATIMVP